MNYRIFPVKALMVFVAIHTLLLSANPAVAADQRYKPFVLASVQSSGQAEAAVSSVSSKLAQNGFELVGQYSPYPGTTILVITNDALRQHAAQSNMGAYGAVLRVTVTKTDSGNQISYTNPVYMSHVYQMKSDLTDINSKLAKVLGHEKEYGSEEGLTKDELRNYQYKWLMPYFSDRHELVDYGNQQKALEKIEKILATKAGGAVKVYRVDLPGKEESVIGVNLTGPEDNECSGDKYIMSRIDFKKIKSAGHLPYEFVVSKGKVYALYAEFRIAINFPDLSMMGSNSFASIMCAPSSIKTALTKAVGGKEGESDF